MGFDRGVYIQRPLCWTVCEIFLKKSWIYRECLVSVSKQQYLVFNQYFTYFYTFFHLHVFSQKFLNNNFQFLNTCTKRTHRGRCVGPCVRFFLINHLVCVWVWRLHLCLRFFCFVLFFHVFWDKFYCYGYCSCTVHKQQPQSLTCQTIFKQSVHTVHCSRTHEFHFLATFSLKMGLTVLFTYLKIILLQCFSVFNFIFQFSAVSKRIFSQGRNVLHPWF